MASVLVGELVAGDGFFSPQQGSEIVVKCIMGVFYDDAEVVRDDKVNKAMKVDGKDAWLVETHLSFDIPNLQAKGETAIIVIVATKPESSSIYYASIPDNADPQLLNDAREAMVVSALNHWPAQRVETFVELFNEFNTAVEALMRNEPSATPPRENA